MSIEEQLAVAEYSQVECYNKGYKDAIENACEWLCEHIGEYARLGEDGAWIEHSVVKDFRKVMENDNDKGRTD